METNWTDMSQIISGSIFIWASQISQRIGIKLEGKSGKFHWVILSLFQSIVGGYLIYNGTH